MSNANPIVEQFKRASEMSLLKKEYKNKMPAFIKGLLKKGRIKMLHPDDEWCVNKETNELHPYYPSFNLGVEVGDLIMLGDFKKNRIVRCKLIRESPFHMLGDPCFYGFEGTYEI